jgi:hypothetical protein
VDPAGRLLVDAANVVGSRPDGWWRDRAGAARRLTERVCAAGFAGEVVLVLEGAARAGVAEGPTPGEARVRVQHAPASGDDTLAALAGPHDVVVTADAELRERVTRRGARVVGPGWLWSRLDSAQPDSAHPEGD